MCLLGSQPAGTVWDEEHIRDFYSRNSDGIGVMWAESGVLYSQKIVPTKVQDAIDFTNEFINGRECIWHWRMRTHGNVDLTNCHPYPLLGFEGQDVNIPMLLMHNGVLSTGNAADTTKSDTWHYIRDFLRPILANNPDWAFSPEFEELIAKHIGGNRFAIMDAHGRSVIVNRRQGVEYKGAWLSNTYAWSAHKFMPKPAYTYQPYSGGTGVYTGGSYHNGKQGYWAGGKFHAFHEVSLDDAPKSKGAPAKKPAATSPRGGKKNAGAPKLKAGTVVKHRNTEFTANGKGGWTTHTPQQLPLVPAPSSTVPQEWVDDVLEVRSILDVIHPDHTTRDSQIVQMLEVMAPTRVYAALELVHEKHQTTRFWDNIASSVLEMREFMRHSLDEYRNADSDASDERAPVVQ